MKNKYNYLKIYTNLRNNINKTVFSIKKTTKLSWCLFVKNKLILLLISICYVVRNIYCAIIVTCAMCAKNKFK